jgi:hypothetical protein
MTYKTCPCCHTRKTTSLFHRNIKRKDLVQTYCKLCEKKKEKNRRETYKPRRELEKLARANWIKKNKIKHREYQKVKSREYYKLMPERKFFYYIKTQYNITKEEYIALLKKNNYECNICGIHQSKLKKRLILDHNHKCCDNSKPCKKCIRGLLCDACNRGLGCFSDDTNKLSKAINYINSYKPGSFLC